ncbi:MAG: GTP 3',8-cyclase MoaA [Sphingomonadaceae bacterium]|nr:GTP 3',8-cyclase MoaA [Sphingomonadaceae bacterium]
MSAPAAPAEPRFERPPLVDPFGRRIRYLRMSVTDRCDLRCRYCMSERMVFRPADELLSFDELDQIAGAFIRRGVTKIRLTGGEPLVRKGVMGLVERLSRHLASGALEELTLTTNGTRLAEFAKPLAAAGVRRVNVSLDSLDPQRFRHITRGGDLSRVLDGIAAATAAGIAIKLNVVALKGLNEDELPSMVAWAHRQGYELTFIESMPLGDVEHDRALHFLPLIALQELLRARYTLTPLDRQTGGPARYMRVAETGGTVGFIAPLTRNFCEGCNRVRLTATGTLYLCLGQSDAADLRAVLRAAPGDAAALGDAIARAVAMKPFGHEFRVAPDAPPALERHMSVTGG